MAGEMSFWDHLEELRWCLLRVVVVFVIALVGCFIALPHIFDTLILGPAHADFAGWASSMALARMSP